MANTYKVLGQSAPTNTSNANLYTVPSATSATVSTLHIANVTTSAVAAQVWVRVAGAAAANSNILVPAVSIPANGIYAFTEGITLGAGDIITVQSATANALTFQLFGAEIA